MVIALWLGCPAPPEGTAALATVCRAGHYETCNGLDDDCDGLIDEVESRHQPVWYLDVDADGFGYEGESIHGCLPPAGYAVSAGDCAPDDASRYPQAPEVCNGIDDDCDQLVDADDPNAVPENPGSYADEDRDGFGADAPAVCGGSPVRGDCEDQDPFLNPLTVWTLDLDGDGVGGPLPDDPPVGCERPPHGILPIGDVDCDDADPSIFPGGQEVCGGGDEDCDGFVDDSDVSVLPSSRMEFHLDQDGDGIGLVRVGYVACAPTGDRPWSLVGGDCNDNNPFAPGPETCEVGDEDCDGKFGIFDPDTDLSTATTRWADADGDGLGNDAISFSHCEGPTEGTADVAGDCNDQDPTAGAPASWGPDADGDGSPALPLEGIGCAPPPGMAMSWGGVDCDDGDATVSPLREEDLAAGDADCDGLEGATLTEVDFDWIETGPLGLGLSSAPDLDGDGRAEILASGPTEWYLHDAVGDQTMRWFLRDEESAADDAPEIVDLDADGVLDVVLPASESSSWFAGGGAVWFHLGDGDPWDEADTPAGLAQGGVTPLVAADALGHGLAADDADHDGWVDVTVSRATLTGHGRVAHFRGPVAHNWWSESEAHFTLVAGSPIDLGDRLVWVGDLDGDGVSDLAVGAPDTLDGSGAILIVDASATGTIDAADIERRVDGIATSRMGAGRMARVGDLTGDGRDDLIGPGPFVGLVGLFQDVTGLTPATSSVASVSGTPGHCGGAIARAGDLDGDGALDLATTCDGGLLGQLGPLAGPVDSVDADLLFGPMGSDGRRELPSTLRDLDGDGSVDLVLAAPFSELGGWVASRLGPL